MRVDVVVNFYKQHNLWPLLKWGFGQNYNHINSVIVVNDGPKEEIAELDEINGVEVVKVGHVRDGFGLCESSNLGIEDIATTEYVLLMEGDEILAPNSLQDTIKYAKPYTLLACPKQYIRSDTTLENLMEDDVVYVGHERRHLLPKCQINNRHYLQCSGGHLLIHRPSHIGFNEGYKYGLHDYDYAIRWMKKWGKERFRLEMGAGEVWHIEHGVTRPSIPQPSWSMMAKEMGWLFNNRYHLGCGKVFDPTCLNVDLDGAIWEVNGPDVIADCKKLEWMGDSEAVLIKHSHFIEHMHYEEALEHLKICFNKLKSGGMLCVAFPDVKVAAAKLLAATDDNEVITAIRWIYGDCEDDKGVDMRHAWGWSAKSMQGILESIGFDIVYCGADEEAKLAPGRDTVIKALKP